MLTLKDKEVLQTIIESLSKADLECHNALIWSDDFPDLHESILDAYANLQYALGYARGKRWVDVDKREIEGEDGNDD